MHYRHSEAAYWVVVAVVDDYHFAALVSAADWQCHYHPAVAVAVYASAAVAVVPDHFHAVAAARLFAALPAGVVVRLAAVARAAAAPAFCRLFPGCAARYGPPHLQTPARSLFLLSWSLPRLPVL